MREIYVEEKTLRALEEAFPTTVQASQPEGNAAIESESVRELATPGKRPEESKAVVRYAEPIQHAGSLPKPPVLELPEGTKTEQWNWLKEKVLNCETRASQLNPNAQVVFGTGNLDTDLFLCGKPRVPRRRRKGCPSLVPRENCWSESSRQWG